MDVQLWLSRILSRIEQAQIHAENHPPSRAKQIGKYAFAIVLQVFLFILSYQLKREPEVAFALLYLMLSIVSTLSFGFGPGLVSAMLAAFSVNYHYVKPVEQAELTFHSIAFLLAFVVLYGLTVSLFAVLVEAVKRSVLAKKVADEAVFHRDELLEVIAHDLRQPLGAAMMQVQLQKLDSPVLGSLQRMDRLISDLLDSSKSEKGILTLNLTDADLKDAIEQSIAVVSELAKRKRISLTFEAASLNVYQCKIDMDRMVRVLVNLIGNAIKFTPSGGTVSIHLKQTEHSDFEVKVQDSGPGVPDEEVKFLFHKNWQNRKTAHLGSGLGLYICKSIVCAHHGKVWYEKPNTSSGAIFAFSIPKEWHEGNEVSASYG